MPTRLVIGLERSATRVHAALVGPAGQVESAASDPPPAELASVVVSRNASEDGDVTAALRALVSADERAATATAVCVTTSDFEDALAERRDLARTASVRLVPRPDQPDAPLGVLVSEGPGALADAPASLRKAVGVTTWVLPGGCQLDGHRRAPADAEQFSALARALVEAEVGAVAITSTFASVDPAAELEAADRLAAHLPGVPVTVSQPLGSLGLLARESATVLNAALRPLAERLTRSLGTEVARVLPDARPYLTRTDGTVMELPYAARLPALTLGAVSGSRLRGAARLAGVADCLVSVPHPGPGDAGAATWVAIVRDGEPSRAPRGLVIEGVQTSLAAADLIEVGSGAAGRAGEVTVLDVPDRAGAVGAASSRIVGLVDRIVSSGRSRDPEVIERAGRDAREQALLAGALEETIEVGEISESPLAYVPGDLVRLRVTATGRVPTR